MNDIGQGMYLLVAEILGLVPLFCVHGRVKNRVADANVKRNEILMPIFSVLFSVLSVMTCLAIRHVCGEIVNAWLGSDQWEEFKQILSLLDICTTTWLFLYLYKRIKHKFYGKVIDLGTEFNLQYKEFLGIYVIDAENGGYILSKKGEYAKTFVFTFMCLDICLLFLAYWALGIFENSIFEVRILHVLPISCLTVLSEIWYFLYCPSKSEITRKSERYGSQLDLNQLRMSMLSYAHDRGITVKTDYQRNFVQTTVTLHQVLKKYQGIDHMYVQHFIQYLKNKSLVGSHYNASSIDTAMHLIRNKNVFYATPFYKDAGICIFFPAYLAVLKREKALVILEDSGNLEEIAQWIKAGVEEIPNMLDLWDVNVQDDITESTDIGILSVQYIYSGKNSDFLAPFLKTVSFVAVIEASSLLTGGQETVFYLASKIGKSVEERTWLLCDRNAESMLDLFSHLLNAEFSYVSATPRTTEEAVVFYWDTETEPNQIWSPSQRYLGIEAGILEIDKKNHIPLTTWYGEEVMPVIDMKWIMGQYYLQYGKQTLQNIDQIGFNQQLECRISGMSCDVQEEKTLIIEDNIYNLYEVGRQYITRASKRAAIHVLSPNYMLRDFMKDREDTMKVDPKFIAQFVPEYVNTKRNVAIHLIRRMLEDAVSESEAEALLDKSEEAIFENMSWITKIRELVQMVLNIPDVNVIVTYRYVFSESMETMKQEPYYQIVDDRVSVEFHNYFQQASYIDERNHREHIGKLILAGHLELKYLPGQLTTLNGKYYEVTGFIEDTRGKVIQVKRASDRIMGRRYYRQLRSYMWKKVREDNEHRTVVYKDKRLIVKRCEMDLEASTYGYVEMQRFNDVKKGRQILYKTDGRKCREYHEKQVLKIEFPELENEKRYLVYWLAVLLQESLCTFYPQYYHILSVAIKRCDYEDVIDVQDKDTLWRLLADIQASSTDQLQSKSEPCFYILEDSREDMGLLRSIENHFQQIMDILKEYVAWSRDTKNSYLGFEAGAYE